MTHNQRRQRRLDIAAYLALGNTIEDTARVFGVTTNTVRECRSQSAGQPWVSQEILLSIVAALLNTTASQTAIAAQHSVSIGVVSKVYRLGRAAGIRFKERHRGHPEGKR